MINRTTTLAACFIAAALTACSSSDSTTTTTDAGTGTGTDSGVVKDSGGSTSNDTGAGTADTGSTVDAGSPDEQCAADKKTCQSCCQSGHSAGFQVYLQALLTCGCKAGVCDTACKTTACASPPAQPDNACISCLQGTLSPDAGKSCAGDVTKACVADTDCKALNDCAGGCQ